MKIIDVFLQNVRKAPGKTALITPAETVSYVELEERVRRLTLLLEERGIRRGANVLVVLNNTASFAALLLSAAELGITLVPLSTSSSPRSLATAARSTGAAFLIAARPVVKKLIAGSDQPFPIPPHRCLTDGGAVAGCRGLEEAARFDPHKRPLGITETAPADPYILTMTSGSTGDPKPIVLTQETKLERAFAGARDLYGLGCDEVVLVASPMYHSLGQRLVLLPFLLGGSAVLLPRFTPAGWLTAVENHGVTFTIAVSSHLELLVTTPAFRPRALRSLRCIVSSSSLLKNEMKKRCLALFPCEFHECYGTSEIGIAANLAPGDWGGHLGSVGRALPYVELKIVGPHGGEKPPGEVGEIICRTPTAFAGYFQRPDFTRAGVVDGFFYTGDLGYLDPDGFLYLSGRKKELIIVGGTNVYPRDVEAVVSSHPQVKECAVIGIDDPRFGEAVLAVIVPSGDTVDARSIQRLCLEELADYQQPMAYETVTELPRNPLGKIMKHKLKERFTGYDATARLRALIDGT